MFAKHSKRIGEGFLEYEHLKDEKAMTIFDECGYFKKKSDNMNSLESNEDEVSRAPMSNRRR